MNDKIYITADELDTPKCERECQETSINWLRDESIVRVSSSDPIFITKMKKKMRQAPDLYICYSYVNNKDKKTGRYMSYFFEFPKKLLSFKNVLNQNRKPMSEEQKQEAAERFRKMWEAKKLAGEIDVEEEFSLEDALEEFEEENED